MTNVAGTTFDVQDEGEFNLLSYPTSAHAPHLKIVGNIERYTGGCHSTFIKQLMLSGDWIIPMNVSVDKVISRKPKLVLTTDTTLPENFQKNSLITSKNEQKVNVYIKSQDIQIDIDATNCRRKQWCDEGKWVHLNLNMRGLNHLEPSELGGILGNEEYVAKGCTSRNLFHADNVVMPPLSYAKAS
jgi:hypothetical protein